jgi:hypothetical protein
LPPIRPGKEGYGLQAISRRVSGMNFRQYQLMQSNAGIQWRAADHLHAVAEGLSAG